MKKVVLITIFLCLLAIFIVGCSQTGRTVSSNCRDVQVSYEEQEEYLKTEYYTETVPYTDTVCESKEIPYSINNFIMNYETCNEYQDVCNKYILGICSDKTTFCVDKSVSCSLDLKNLDNEEGGAWTIRFKFYERGTDTTIKNDDVTNYLYPQSSKQFIGNVRITSEGVEGNANKKITCVYQQVDLPKKQVCRDVTKYKEVQRERQVTAYRPVTKYKTERVCG